MAIGAEVKTQALALAISYITGRYPSIERHPDYNQIVLDADQVREAREYLTGLIEREPGNVRIEVNNVIFPVLLKKYWPWALAATAGLVGIGALLKQK